MYLSQRKTQSNYGTFYANITKSLDGTHHVKHINVVDIKLKLTNDIIVKKRHREGT